MAEVTRDVDLVTVVRRLMARVDTLELRAAATWDALVTSQLPLDASSTTVRQIQQHFSANAVFTAGGATVTFPVAFPTACDGAVWMFDNSVGAGSISVTGLGVRTASTVGLVATGGTATLGVVVWAWGH